MPIQIANPRSNEAEYTSANRANSLVKNRMAKYLGDGRLWIFPAYRNEQIPYHPLRIASDMSFWNGSPKPKILQKLSIRTIRPEGMAQGCPMRRPGEVRS